MNNKRLYESLTCALTHNLHVCDKCKKCHSRSKLFEELKNEQFIQKNPHLLDHVNKLLMKDIIDKYDVKDRIDTIRLLSTGFELPLPWVEDSHNNA